MPQTQASLRQTMFCRIFNHALVFDTEGSVNAFQRRCHQRQVRIDIPVIAVDGRGGLNLGGLGCVRAGSGHDARTAF